MKPRDTARLLEERQRLLEIEAELQRATLAASFARLRERRLLQWGTTFLTWSWRLLAVPRIRWLLIGSALARLRSRRRKK